MQKNHKVSFILAGLLALTACSNQIRDDNLALDYDWE
ncbi:MAG: OmpA family protein, partial [Vibrio sp.]|nr:OmpA family protein [Vibrio sp.]